MATVQIEKCQDSYHQLQEAIHGLAQPLTSLQCRLEIGVLLGDEVSAQEALQESLTELRRVLAALAHLRLALGNGVSGRPA